MPRTAFRIVIEGTGQHHEGSTLDADYLATRLVNDLINVGQQVDSVAFTPGGSDPSRGVYALYASDSLGTAGPPVEEVVEPPVEAPAVVVLPPLDEAPAEDPLAEG